MATIYDVAKHAGTSISTVSHYLNKTKYVGPDKSKKIKEAVEALDYIPNKAAKHLKSNTSNEIHILMPNLSEPLYVKTYEGILEHFSQTIYSVALHLTGDVASVENKCLIKVQKSAPAGFIICSCLEKPSKLLHTLMDNIPHLLLFRIFSEETNALSVVYDTTLEIRHLYNQLQLTDHTDAVLLAGPEHLSISTDTASAFEALNPEGHVHFLPYKREEAFSLIADYYSQCPMPTHVLSTSPTLTEAWQMLQSLTAKTINEQSCITIGKNNDHHYTGIYAAKLIEAYISNPMGTEQKTHVMNDTVEISSSLTSQPILTSNQTDSIRMLLLEDDNSVSAMKVLATGFETRTGINLEIDTVRYDNYYDVLEKSLTIPSRNYDIVSVDLPWLDNFTSGGLIHNLSDVDLPLDAHKNAQNDYLYPIKLSVYGNCLYGVPYLIGLQMLFYRKDLFENQDIKEAYFALYGRELAPPNDWYTYNQIARFFTKAFNRQSPTAYGTCLADFFKESILGELLPRIWAYKGTLLDQDGLPYLSAPQTKDALNNYIESTGYADSSSSHLAEDVAKRFAEGDIAMITSYLSYAPLLFSKNHRPLKGLFGFAPMPNETSMVSGWSLCIPENSTKKDASKAFIKWFLSSDVMYHYGLMTGCPLTGDLFKNKSFNRLYPWLNDAYDIFYKGHTRDVIDESHSMVDFKNDLETTLTNIIYKYQQSNASLHSLLKQADRDLRKQTT